MRDRTKRVSARSQACRKTTAARPRPIEEFTVTARPLSSLTALLLASLAFAASAGAATPGPNGRIAFVRIPPGSHNFEQLYSAAADGSDVKRLDWVDLSDESPAWSPDGTRIAFSRGNGGGAIWVMNADGTGQTQVTTSGIGDIWPSW